MKMRSLLTRTFLASLISIPALTSSSEVLAFQTRTSRGANTSDDANSENGGTRAAEAKGNSKSTNPKSPARRTNSKRVPASVVTGQILETDNGIQLVAPRTMDMRFGMRFSSNENYCTGIQATIPFPMEWPEQKITIRNHEIPDNMVWDFRDLPAGARQLVMQMKGMAPSSDLNMVVHVQIEKSFINVPENTSQFRIPKTAHPELQWYLGSSPYIDVNNSEIKRTARSIAEAKPQDAWTHVEMIYDWVRSEIEYTHGPIRHIKDSLKDRKGDCEEMTGIFVALCRASKIPARCVWIPEHCYPEFYLEDEDGKGHWFPCQAAGERQFGQMHDYRPILQKGDRFKIPEEKGTQRYVASFFKCNQRPIGIGGRSVEIQEIVDLGSLQQELESLREDAALGGSNSTTSGSTTTSSGGSSVSQGASKGTIDPAESRLREMEPEEELETVEEDPDADENLGSDPFKKDPFNDPNADFDAED